jgi:hypothetical protein
MISASANLATVEGRAEANSQFRACFTLSLFLSLTPNWHLQKISRDFGSSFKASLLLARACSWPNLSSWRETRRNLGDSSAVGLREILIAWELSAFSSNSNLTRTWSQDILQYPAGCKVPLPRSLSILQWSGWALWMPSEHLPLVDSQLAHVSIPYYTWSKFGSRARSISRKFQIEGRYWSLFASDQWSSTTLVLLTPCCRGPWRWSTRNLRCSVSLDRWEQNTST